MNSILQVGFNGRKVAPPVKRFLILIIIFVANMFVWSGYSENLLTNGSFELPATNGTSLGYAYFPGGSSYIPGWTTLLYGVEYADPSQSTDGVHRIYLGVAEDGSYMVDLPPVTFTGGGGIAQSFPTVIGQTYEVSLYMGNVIYQGRDGTGTLIVSAANTTNFFAMTNLTGFVQWSGRSFNFTAVSNTSTLAFRSFDNPKQHFSYIDNVSVVRQQSTTLSLEIRLFPGIQINGQSGHTYVVEFAQPPNTNLFQMQYVTLPMLSNMVFDLGSPGTITRSYRAFEWLAGQTLGNEVTVTVVGLTPGIEVNGSAGQTYTVQWSSTLATTNWQSLSDITLKTSSGLLFNPGSLGVTTRFYRGLPSLGD